MLRFYQSLPFAMALTTTSAQEKTLNHNSQLVVGVSPHTPWLAAIKEQNAQLVTGRGSPAAYSPRNQDTRMDLSNTATQEETLLTPRNQQMVVGQNLQLPPNHLFGDNSQLVVGVSPHTPWLDATGECSNICIPPSHNLHTHLPTNPYIPTYIPVHMHTSQERVVQKDSLRRRERMR